MLMRRTCSPVVSTAARIAPVDGVSRSTTREPDGGRRPDARRRRQAADRIAAKDNRTRPEKADAARHLRGDARGIERDIGCAEDVSEAERGHEHEEAGADADERVRSQAGRAFEPLTLGADAGPEQRGGDESYDDLTGGQHHACAESRASIEKRIDRCAEAWQKNAHDARDPHDRMLL